MIIKRPNPILATAVAVLLLLILVGCGGTVTGPAPNSTAPISLPLPSNQNAGPSSRQGLSDLLASPSSRTTPAPFSSPNRLPTEGTKAPEIGGIRAWINSGPLTVQELRGKVVLVDFWTYTCINCIRTFPFLKLWHSRYTDDGLVIIGVHTPEFDFENNPDNVVKATLDNGILWPVAMDNDYVTWRNYSNHFWPAKYLIDREGVVRYTHFGEGAYAETETNIRQLLVEAGVDLSDNEGMLPSDQDLDPDYLNARDAELTRELYAGYRKGNQDALYGQGGYVRQLEYYADQDATVFFQVPEELFPHLIYFNGFWVIGPESARHGQDTDNYEDYLSLVYSARTVNVVLGVDSIEAYNVRVTVNGEYLTEENKGSDIIIGSDGESYLAVREPRMYEVISHPNYARRQTLRMSSNSGDYSLFAFTFGVYQKEG